MKLVPNSFKWSVMTKKAGYAMAKLIVAGITSVTVGKDIDIKGFEEGLALVLIGTLEAGHDWARMKWPDVKWL